MIKYNEWEIKQLLDLTAKSLNSLIINGKETDISVKSFEYLAIYKKLLDTLKMPEPVWGAIKQEVADDISRGRDIKAELAETK